MNGNYSNPKNQNGMTLISLLLLLGVIGFLALLALRVIPIYSDHFSIKGSLMALEEQKDLYQMRREDILKTLDRRMQVNRVDDTFKHEHFFIELKDNGNKVFRIEYEDRRPVMGNIDVVVKFKDEIIVTRSGTVIGV